jgi:hypothetical protein
MWTTLGAGSTAVALLDPLNRKNEHGMRSGSRLELSRKAFQECDRPVHKSALFAPGRRAAPIHSVND